MDIKKLENKLDDFNKDIRLETLHILKEKVNKSEINGIKKTNFVNLHCHSFFSFNAYGYSPEHIVWRAFKEGLEVVGIVDFDTLDGVDETLKAGEILGIKTVAGIETRVFIKEYSGKVINSPKEPGVYYLMGTGFYKKPVYRSVKDNFLLKMGDIAKQRNLKMLNKINDFLKDIKIDYEKDVIPLTPQGNVTERHILVALDKKVRLWRSDAVEKLISFWTDKLQVDGNRVLSGIHNEQELQELIRMKLMKYGGIGYVIPEKDSFPSLDEVIDMIENADALPTATWLDGTNEGERNIKEFLQFLIKKGVILLNIIPDRNWNIKDDEEKEIKIRNLKEVIKVARELDLPVIAGTEMNKFRQKFVDDFTVPEMSPYLECFRCGAFFVYGHTQMAKNFNKGYNSRWAKKYLSGRIKRNDFYVKVGKLMHPDENIQGLKDDSISPDEIMKRFGNILKEDKD